MRQMPQASTRSRSCPGPGSGSGRSTTSSGRPTPSKTTARITCSYSYRKASAGYTRAARAAGAHDVSSAAAKTATKTIAMCAHGTEKRSAPCHDGWSAASATTL